MQGQRWALLALGAGAALCALRYTVADGPLPLFFPRDAKEPTPPQPMCDARDSCGESPAVATPRTAYSALSPANLAAWTAVDAAQRRTSAAFECGGSSSSSSEKRSTLVFLGDSIFESLLGTSMGRPSASRAGVPEAFAAAYAAWAQPLVVAIAGDQTQHVLYRLESGGVPACALSDANATFVVLIGTNNLGAGFLPGPTVEGVVAVAEWLRANARGRVVLLGVLPRGDGRAKLPRLCPPRCTASGKAFTSFVPAVDKVNAALRDRYGAASSSFSNGSSSSSSSSRRIEFVSSCGDDLFRAAPSADASGPDEGEEEVDIDLMPDRLHPNAAGHAALARCLLERSSVLRAAAARGRGDALGRGGPS